jgi:hypothetical protein
MLYFLFVFFLTHLNLSSALDDEIFYPPPTPTAPHYSAIHKNNSDFDSENIITNYIDAHKAKQSYTLIEEDDPDKNSNILIHNSEKDTFQNPLTLSMHYEKISNEKPSAHDKFFDWLVEQKSISSVSKKDLFHHFLTLYCFENSTEKFEEFFDEKKWYVHVFAERFLDQSKLILDNCNAHESNSAVFSKCLKNIRDDAAINGIKALNMSLFLEEKMIQTDFYKICKAYFFIDAMSDVIHSYKTKRNPLTKFAENYGVKVSFRETTVRDIISYAFGAISWWEDFLLDMKINDHKISTYLKDPEKENNCEESVFNKCVNTCCEKATSLFSSYFSS